MTANEMRKMVDNGGKIDGTEVKKNGSDDDSLGDIYGVEEGKNEDQIGLENEENRGKSNLNDYWKTVSKGKAAKIVKIKIESEGSQMKNSYNALTQDDVEDEVEAWEMDESREKELEKNKPNVPKVTELTILNIDDMSKEQMAEIVYLYQQETNVTLQRGTFYSKRIEELRKMVITTIKEVKKKTFIKEVKEVAQRIKGIKHEDILSKISEVIDVMRTIVKVSELKEQISATNVVKEFKKTKEAIHLIEQFQDDEMIMIPEHLLNLENCDKAGLEKANYYVLALAVLNMTGNATKTMQLNMKELLEQASNLFRTPLKKKSEGNEKDVAVPKSPPKRSRKELEAMNVTPEKQATRKESENIEGEGVVSSLNEKKAAATTQNEAQPGKTVSVSKKQTTFNEMTKAKQEKKFADKRAQGQNLNGFNVDNVVVNDDQGMDFKMNPDKKLKVVELERNDYWLHSKLHVHKERHIPTLVKMLVRVLRKADPTMVLLPLDVQNTNEMIENEDDVPEEENSLKKWIDIATIQPSRKFAFSMKVATTERPHIVKNRIFDWCGGQKHYVEFKRLDSANIFFAGWLYHIHPKYHNRDALRQWILDTKPIIPTESIHLVPQKVYKLANDDKGSKVITRAIRVEASFEHREKIMKELYRLKWRQGPYKDALFVPNRATEKFTHDMQFQFFTKQNEYLNDIRQRVFRVKGAEWVIDNLTSKKKTTFKEWLLHTKVNDMKILDSVEIGNDHYVRLIYHKNQQRGVQLMMRNLHKMACDTFGEAKIKVMFDVENSPLAGNLYDLEDEYAETLAAALSGNPQMDDNEQYLTAPPVQQQKRMFFKKPVAASFANAVKSTLTTKGSDEKNGNINKGSNTQKDNIDVEQLKSEIYANVTQQVDEKIDKTERKLTKQMNTIKMENDAKIESLRDLVQGNHDKTDQKLDLLLQRFLPPENPPDNPPSAQVEHSSPRGGSQK